MPIEIRELIIKATVVPESGGSSAGGLAADGKNGASPTEEMIRTCVEKVLEIIKEKNDR